MIGNFIGNFGNASVNKFLYAQLVDDFLWHLREEAPKKKTPTLVGRLAQL